MAFALLALLLGAFGHRRLLGAFGEGTLQHLVRLPGNLLHELSHAIVMLGTGYTITGFAVSLFDKSGRGHVVPGQPWLSLARPWVTNLLSPMAPAVFGLAALTALHHWSGAPGLPMALAGVAPTLLAVPWLSWKLWLSFALAFSIAAEMAPSDVDLRVWARPAGVTGILLGIAAFAVEYNAPGTFWLAMATLDQVCRAEAGRALTMAVLGLFAVGPIAWGASRVLRG